MIASQFETLPYEKYGYSDRFKSAERMVSRFSYVKILEKIPACPENWEDAVLDGIDSQEAAYRRLTETDEQKAGRLRAEEDRFRKQLQEEGELVAKYCPPSLRQALSGKEKKKLKQQREYLHWLAVKQTKQRERLLAKKAREKRRQERLLDKERKGQSFRRLKEHRSQMEEAYALCVQYLIGRWNRGIDPKAQESLQAMLHKATVLRWDHRWSVGEDREVSLYPRRTSAGYFGY